MFALCNGGPVWEAPIISHAVFKRDQIVVNLNIFQKFQFLWIFLVLKIARFFQN